MALADDVVWMWNRWVAKMTTKDCSGCGWNVSGVCENTNWKSGKAIVRGEEPACGYMVPGSGTPTSFKQIVPGSGISVGGQKTSGG